MITNLRHMRAVLAVAQTQSMTQAAQMCHITQPAVTAAVAKVEAALGTVIFNRAAAGLTLTPAGAALTLRLQRACGFLDPALHNVSPRARLTTTLPQLRAVIALVETENFTFAARRLGVAQPTLHRAITHLERDAGRPLFDRLANGVIASKPARTLAVAARLALAELDQAHADLAELTQQEVGCVVIGAMPLSRSILLGPAIAAFRVQRKTLPIRVVEGPYADLVHGLRRGEIDLLIGALRPAMDDLDQTMLFFDQMHVVARTGHPLAHGQAIELTDIAQCAWVVAPEGAPARQFFDTMFQNTGLPVPQALVETGSMALMSDLLDRTDHLGFVSARQVARDVAAGRLAKLAFEPAGTARAIGLTTRRTWLPTAAQKDMIAALQAAAIGAG